MLSILAHAGQAFARLRCARDIYCAVKKCAARIFSQHSIYLASACGARKRG